MKAGDSGFLAPVLGGGGGKDAAHLPDQGAFGPEAAGLIQEVPHLGAHIAEAGGCSENDGPGLGQPIHLRQGNMGKGLPGLIGPGLGQGLRRNQLRHLIQTDFGAFHAPGPFGHGLSHTVDVAVHAVKYNLYFHLGTLLSLKISGSVGCKKKRKKPEEPLFLKLLSDPLP